MSCSNGIGIIVWICLLNIKGIVVRGQTGGPNAVAIINGQTMLDCTTNNLAFSNWQRSPDGVSNPITIASGCVVSGNNAAYYRTEQPGGNICRLVIANATRQQAGVYSCFDGASTIYKSLVTVIDPVASIVVYNQSEVVDGDQLNISCSINYTGPSSPAPFLRPLPYWTTSPGQIITNATYHPSTNVVTLISTVTVQKPKVPIFQCNTVFEITGNTDGYNATAPADSFTVGNTAELNVQYGPSTPVITSRPDVITIDGVPCGISVLTCSSTANHAPNYRWYDSSDNVLSATDTLDLPEVNRNYKCEAYNTIRNFLYNESTTYIVSEDNCSTSTVDCCGKTCVLIISALIPYFVWNVIALVVFVFCSERSGFGCIGWFLDQRFPEHKTLTACLLVIGSVFFGLIIIPIVVTVAYCSSHKKGDVASNNTGSSGAKVMDSHQGNGENNREVNNPENARSDQDGHDLTNAASEEQRRQKKKLEEQRRQKKKLVKSICKIVVMWCAVLLIPIAFIVVYVKHCNKMRFEIS